jgi:hypothetical protein
MAIYKYILILGTACQDQKTRYKEDISAAKKVFQALFYKKC